MTHVIGSALYQIKYFGQNSPIIRSVADFRKQKLDALVLWGGSDISPGIYGQENVASVHIDMARDILEMALIEECIKTSTPMVGVCRGAQLLCAAFSGGLYQHTTGHTSGHHPITLTQDVAKEFAEGCDVNVTTCHHQMMILAPDMTALAVSKEPLSEIYVTDKGEERDKRPEVEIAYMERPKIRALMMQYHPEWGSIQSPMGQLTMQLMHKFILK